MRCLRVFFLIYLTGLLVWFLPAHTRGEVTMTARDGSPQPSSCCSMDRVEATTTDAGHCGPSRDPTEKDKANCAVCFWAAGILPTVPVVFDVRPTDLALIEAINALAQCRSLFIPAESLPRGPPTTLA